MTNDTKVAELRAMTAGKRAAWFNAATEEQIAEVTVPCTGEAHTNAHIDNCMVCLHTTWGRVLAPASRDLRYAIRVTLPAAGTESDEYPTPGEEHEVRGDTLEALSHGLAEIGYSGASIVVRDVAGFTVGHVTASDWRAK